MNKELQNHTPTCKTQMHEYHQAVRKKKRKKWKPCACSTCTAYWHCMENALRAGVRFPNCKIVRRPVERKCMGTSVPYVREKRKEMETMQRKSSSIGTVWSKLCGPAYVFPIGVSYTANMSRTFTGDLQGILPSVDFWRVETVGVNCCTTATFAKEVNYPVPVIYYWYYCKHIHWGFLLSEQDFSR